MAEHTLGYQENEKNENQENELMDSDKFHYFFLWDNYTYMTT